MRKILLLSVFCLALLVGHSIQAKVVQSSIIVEKVDPPNWWIGHTLNPIQLIIKGKGFSQSTLRSVSPGVSVLSSSVAANGEFIIATVSIDPKTASVGDAVFRVESPRRTEEFKFELLQLPDSNGKYQGFGPDDVIYLLMVDRFSDGDTANNDPSVSAGFFNRKEPRAYHGGDLQGVIDRLGYLKDLGITAIWMTPVYDNSNRAADYHGYGTVDFYAVEEHFGDLAKFKELVEKAHAVGIKIIQDQVPNHTGPAHPWIDSPPVRNFFNGTRQNHLNNIFDIFALTQPNSDPARIESTLNGWFANILPDINQEAPEATQYLIQNSLWWIGQTGLDGIRADTFPYVPRSFWNKWNAAIKRQYPNFTVVGEVFDGRPGVVSFFQGGATRFDGVDSGLDTAFDFPSCFAIRDFFTRGQISRLSEVTSVDSIYPDASVLVPFFDNHDISRIGNEPEITPEKQILAYTYLLTMRGTPQVYYGDEIGMKGGGDPDNRRDFPGGFPSDTRSAFNAEGRTKNEQKIFASVQKLLAVRRSQPALRGGQMTFLRDSDGIVTYLRSRDNEQVIVAINNTDQQAKWTVKLAGVAEGAKLNDLLEQADPVTVKKGKLKLRLAPRSAAIYKQ
ncbi:MAG: cyclomaltodextrinase N-terminal domain-containing protein [Blastocatellia bacterium]|nr:cyclomaltodextrinase N-terminal domain-containing protein [Blastocatellia bacterium]